MINDTSSDKVYAVVTGDIVNSSALTNEQRTRLLSVLKGSFDKIEPTFGKALLADEIKIFRGDSFQGILDKPEYALQVGILIRAALKAANPGPRNRLWDARIAIGIGKISYFPTKGSEADGEAFHFSGPILDGLKKSRRLSVVSADIAFNKELEVECHLLDALIGKWSAEQAAIVEAALAGINQDELSKQFEISQPAIRKRMQGAGYSAIENFINRYSELVLELQK